MPKGKWWRKQQLQQSSSQGTSSPRDEQPGGRAARGTSSQGTSSQRTSSRGTSSQGTSSQRTSSRGTSSQGVTGYSSQIYNIDRKTRVGQLSEAFPGSPNTRSKLLFRVRQSAATPQQAANHVWVPRKSHVHKCSWNMRRWETVFLHLLKVWLKGLWQMLRQMITALLLTEMKFGEEHWYLTRKP